MQKDFHKPIGRRAFLSLVAVGCALTTTASWAAPDWTKDWYIAPMLSHVWTDSDRDLDDGFGFQGALGKQLNQRFNLELYGHYAEFDLDAGGDYEQSGLGLDLLFFLDRDGRFHPFLLGGGGVMKNYVAGRGDDADQALEAGVGFLYQGASGNWFWRTDLRFRNEVDSDTMPGADGFDDWVLNTGIQIPLGRGSRPEPAPLVTAIAADADGDGVPDDVDACPGTPRGRLVDARGCERDDDRDGVLNSADACPDTASGVAVDGSGCPVPQVVELRGVNFETNSSILTPESTTILDSVAATLLGAPEVRVEVAGHTDHVGFDDYNQWL